MQIENQTSFLEGRVTQTEAGRLLAEGNQAISAGCTAVDLGRVEQVDSAALSLLLAWRRHAAEEKRNLVFHNIPPSLLSLVELYGVGELLSVR